jgi:rhodanese-related sulfurtransferase
MSTSSGWPATWRRELKAKMDRGEDFVLLEVLREAFYRRAHLPGEIRFTDAGKAPELFPDKNTFVVAYCSSFT